VFATRFDGDFIAGQDDAWVISLYQFLDGQKALWRPALSPWTPPGSLRPKPLIRLEDGRHIAAFDDKDSPQAYLPSATRTHFPTVKGTVAADTRARAFLVGFGLTEPGLADEVLEFILPKYPNTDSPANWEWPNPVGKDENLTDIGL
jgi:hypothetical protein